MLDLLGARGRWFGGIGAAAPEATLLVSVFALCQLVSAPLLGQLSDRVLQPFLLGAREPVAAERSAADAHSTT